MFEVKLRQAATAVLVSTMRIAPRDMLDWGRAMMAELEHVENSWAGTMWALGSSSVLAKHALISLVRPGPTIRSDSGLFERESAIGRKTLVATIGCILAVLLFSAAPAYRQAFQLSLAPWHWVFELSAPDRQTAFQDLARRAEAMHDPEGIAFSAIKLQDDRESARLADEAVRLDPNLIWIYAITAVQHPTLPQISQWISKLELWDPQNALFPMILGENIAFLRDRNDCTCNGFLKDPARKTAMQAAFAKEEFNDYSDRMVALECKVMPRYGAYLPDQVIWSGDEPIPFADTRNYAQYLLLMGQKFADQGNHKDAARTFWIVAHQGELLDLRGHNSIEHGNAAVLQINAYDSLRSLAKKDGNEVQAAHFTYLVNSLDPVRVRALAEKEDSHTADVIARWDAWQVIGFGMLMPVFIICLVTSVFILIFKWNGAPPSAFRARRLAAKFAVTGSVGLFLSSTMLFVAFHPYAESLNTVLSNAEPVAQAAKFVGSVPEARDNTPYAQAISRLMIANSREATSLRGFLFYTQHMPFQTKRSLLASATLNAVYDFWLAVIVMGFSTIFFVAFRHLRHLPRAENPA